MNDLCVCVCGPKTNQKPESRERIRIRVQIELRQITKLASDMTQSTRSKHSRNFLPPHTLFMALELCDRPSIRAGIADEDTIISGRPVVSASILRQAAAFSGACHSGFCPGVCVRQRCLWARACVYVLLFYLGIVVCATLSSLPSAQVLTMRSIYQMFEERSLSKVFACKGKTL